MLIPQEKIKASKIFIKKDMQLADPAYNKPGKIDILIGAGLYWKILIESPRNKVDGQPALQNTSWVGSSEENYTAQDAIRKIKPPLRVLQ